MGCTPSKEIDINDPLYQAKQADRAIQEALERSNRDRKVKKLLLLGAGESGKSTVLKQLKILHKTGFSYNERAQYAQVIWADAVNCMAKLIIQARKMKIPLDCDAIDSPLRGHRDNLLAYQKHVLRDIDTETAGGHKFIRDYLTKYSPTSEIRRQQSSTGRSEAFTDVFPDGMDNKADAGSGEETDTLFTETEIYKSSSDSYHEDAFDNLIVDSPKLDGSLTGFVGKAGGVSLNTNMSVSREDVATAVLNLWNHDQGIRRTWSRANEFQIESNADYYFDNVSKFADQGYLASDTDILNARIKTTGITETHFTIHGEEFKILDAGGQRLERRKWLKSFEDITAVLFVLAVSEYDQQLFENGKVNRMHESMMLFKTLVNSRWFQDTPFILFLNKTDLFEQKIKKQSMRTYLPDFNGKAGNVEDGLRYFEKTFQKFNRTNKPIYVHRTCATDTLSMKFVLAAVTDLFMQSNLKATGMM